MTQLVAPLRNEKGNHGVRCETDKEKEKWYAKNYDKGLSGYISN